MLPVESCINQSLLSSASILLLAILFKTAPAKRKKVNKKKVNKQLIGCKQIVTIIVNKSKYLLLQLHSQDPNERLLYLSPNHWLWHYKWILNPIHESNHHNLQKKWGSRYICQKKYFEIHSRYFFPKMIYIEFIMMLMKRDTLKHPENA